jgi:hypothetical protein
MRKIRLRAAAVLAAAWLSLPVFSHQEESASGADLAPLDCDHLPAGAITTLPEAIRPFAALECAPNGQLIVAREHWVWRFPASYFDRAFIASYTPEASRSKPGPRWFTSLGLKELQGEAARAQHEALLRQLPNYSGDPAPKTVYHLLAQNEQGDRFDVFFPMTSESKGWGAICAPDCEPQMLFMIYKQE